MKSSLVFPSLTLIALISACALFIGCQSTPKVDWNTRVSTYTYDQAVAELGVPDKSADLSDGSRVAEWVTRRRGGSAISLGVGSYGRNTGVGVSQTVGTSGQPAGLRLTFDPAGRLVAWSGN